MVTLTLFQLEGAKARPRTQSWGGQSRSVYAIRAVTLTLLQLEGAQGRPPARSWGGGGCRSVFAVSKLTITLAQFAGEIGCPRSPNWGGAVGVFFAIRAATLPLLPLDGAKGRPRPQN